MSAQENLAPINAAPGARTWSWSGHGISVRLTHIVPDQLRGFYQARGFTPKDAELIAGACVFQTVIRNDTPNAVVKSDLTLWRAIIGETQTPLRVREDWEQLWQQREVPKRARLAFRWALFPTKQVFHHGDWNMGMSSYGLPPGAKFDLSVSFTIDGRPVEGRIKDVQCADQTR